MSVLHKYLEVTTFVCPVFCFSYREGVCMCVYISPYQTPPSPSAFPVNEIPRFDGDATIRIRARRIV
jgi:hypothetical protein